MLFAADGLITPGGPSAPVWAFLTAISVGILGIIGQQIAAKREARIAKEKASVAAQNAEQAVENTKKVSNGFADRMDRKLDTIHENQIALSKALREHLAWHLQNEKKEKE